MKIMPSVWKIVWKTPVVLGASAVGYIAASQAGWSGAESIVNTYMGTFHDFATDLYFIVGAAISLGAVALVQ